VLVVDQHDEDHSDEFDDIVRAIHRADFATIWKGGIIAPTPAAIPEKLDAANRDPAYWTFKRNFAQRAGRTIGGDPSGRSGQENALTSIPHRPSCYWVLREGNMSVDEQLRVLSDRIKTHSSAMLTEEAVKTAIVLPFLHALDYDVFNPNEVVPEFSADAVGKKGEKVDYAIKVDDEIRILIECKPIATSLEKHHLAQLYRYFSVTSAKFAILTNGRTFQFHTDLEAPNKLDDRPFLTFDLSDLQGQLTAELKKFAKAEFSVDGIMQSAHRLKYTSAIKKAIVGIMEEPPEEFVRREAFTMAGSLLKLRSNSLLWSKPHFAKL